MGLEEVGLPNSEKTTGFYFMLEFEGAGDIVTPLEIAFKRDERVMRFLTVKMDKHHFEWAEKRRARRSNTQVDTSAPVK